MCIGDDGTFSASKILMFFYVKATRVGSIFEVGLSSEKRVRRAALMFPSSNFDVTNAYRSTKSMSSLGQWQLVNL